MSFFSDKYTIMLVIIGYVFVILPLALYGAANLIRKFLIKRRK